MPKLLSLKLNSFRNIGAAALFPHPQINVVFGQNGAGKSSLLEAMSVLAHGRSFRTSKFRNLIQDDSSAFTVFARLISDDGVEFPMGMQRTRNGDVLIKINEKKVSSAVELAISLPFLVINSNSFRLVEGSPKERRKFFDWLVFHVKHEFAGFWRDYSRCLKQRNSLLRDKIAYPEVEPWDRELSRLGANIDTLRRVCWLDFQAVFSRLCQDNSLSFGERGRGDISISYDNGWNEASRENDLFEQLRSSYPKDLRLGFTSVGSHKADFTIRAANKPASEVLSRGQIKLLISVMYAAEAQMYSEKSCSTPVVAVDDMPSELDLDNQRLLASLLNRIGCQCFITAINPDFIEQVWPGAEGRGEIKMFHVKHGLLEEMSPSTLITIS